MIIFILYATINAIEFTQSLSKREIVCYGDNLTGGLTVQGEITSQSSEYSIKIYNPMRFKKEGYIHQSQNQLTQDFNFKAKYNHNIQMCIQNLSTKILIFTLRYQQLNHERLQQIDMQLPMNKLQPIENHITEMKIIYDTIKSLFQDSTERQENQLEGFKQLSTKIIVFSFILMLLILIITFAGTYKYKKMLNSKKFI